MVCEKTQVRARVGLLSRLTHLLSETMVTTSGEGRVAPGVWWARAQVLQHSRGAERKPTQVPSGPQEWADGSGKWRPGLGQVWMEARGRVTRSRGTETPRAVLLQFPGPTAWSRCDPSCPGVRPGESGARWGAQLPPCWDAGCHKWTWGSSVWAGCQCKGLVALGDPQPIEVMDPGV